MKIIWNVNGVTGEYSDRMEWVVASFVSISKAKKLSDTLVEKTTELGVNRNTVPRGVVEYSARDGALEELRKLDPNCSLSYTGTDYSVGFDFLFEEGEEYVAPTAADFERAIELRKAAGI